MHKKKLKFITSIVACAFSLLLMYLLVLDITGAIPSEYNLQMGDQHIINSRFPLSFSINSEESDILQINQVNVAAGIRERLNRGIELKTINKGTADLEYRILGFIPYKTVKVNVVPKFEVIPGGQSIGVKLNTEGVLVVGIADIINEAGQKISPAEAGGIKVGDTLLAVNHQPVENALHVAELIQKNGQNPIVLSLRRNNTEYSATLYPVRAQEDGQYRLGLWVRDKTAGVGTLTFYHEDTGKFGALGHGIADVDTGSLMSIKDGEVMASKVISIQEGKKGKPGEIRGIFHDVNNPIGILKKNSPYGVYGEVLRDMKGSYHQPMEIAYQHEIKEGPAYILTTLDDNQVEKYEIEILRVIHQSKPDGKSMIIRVTDERLLDKTGGIVQGMSGSPIIQNNRVVGAVTHVLVNDPTRGYGIFIEWMLQESGVFDSLQPS
ncbi:SpoIVB peptidase [Alkaliphilus crotonatoxidans]